MASVVAGTVRCIRNVWPTNTTSDLMSPRGVGTSVANDSMSVSCGLKRKVVKPGSSGRIPVNKAGRK